jgi:Cytochrome bd terminal oxidase subunit II
MDGALLDLVPIWATIIALGIFLYVLLDGFDLGVGMLYGLAAEEHRTTIMNTAAPIWDGNETWLILGGVALFAVFPLAFAIIIPALYFPVLLMLWRWYSEAWPLSSGSGSPGFTTSGPTDFVSALVSPPSLKGRCSERLFKALRSMGVTSSAHHGNG